MFCAHEERSLLIVQLQISPHVLKIVYFNTVIFNLSRINHIKLDRSKGQR